ncbi:MAG: hypothetical protein EAZ61_01995 [Oscillatoriales cyanobacterium]|nr:MAG: hypothetical protein EAZ61_01995 [Oscillatoriales cyanobacterium]
MFLKTIKVKQFRVLNDFDISFERKLSASVFPVGSLNGGGKSTLLQLIFVLLNCSPNESRCQYVKNLFSQDESLRKIFNEDSQQKKKEIIEVASMEVEVEDSTNSLDFSIVNNQFMGEEFDLGILAELDRRRGELIKYSGIDISYLESSLFSLQNEIDSGKNIGISEIRELHEIASNIKEEETLPISFRRVLSRYGSRLSFDREWIEVAANEFNFAFQKIQQKVDDLSEIIRDLTKYISSHRDKEKEINNKLKELGYLLLTRLGDYHVLVCKTEITIEEFKKISEKIYLCSSSTQAFLFLERKEVHSLFSRLETQDIANYFKYFCQVLSELPCLYMYDFSLVNQITDSFKKASDKDRAQAISTGGTYGSYLSELISDLNSFFQNKDITVSPDLDRVIFKVKGKNIELSPEDLSHGELKRIGIYTWLKYTQVENSVVLMDEIETGLHPDWQYEIVNELQKWSSGNQFILATHSYEVCEAVTPAHVKDLNPKLTRSRSKID